MCGEAFEEVVGVGLRDWSAVAPLPLRDRGHLPPAPLQDLPVAPRDDPVVPHGEPPVRSSHDLPPRDEQQLPHPPGPRPAVAVGHGLELAQQVSAAQLVLAVRVGEVGLPAVVDDDAPVPGDDADVVDGLASAPAVQPLDRDVPTGADVDPVVPAVHPQRCLVGVQHRHLQEHGGGGLLPRSERVVKAPDIAQAGGLGELQAAGRVDQGDGPVQREHLRDQQVDGEGLEAGAVLERAGHAVGEPPPGPGPARGTVLDLGVHAALDGLEDDVVQDAALPVGRVDA